MFKIFQLFSLVQAKSGDEKASRKRNFIFQVTLSKNSLFVCCFRICFQYEPIFKPMFLNQDAIGVSLGCRELLHIIPVFFNRCSVRGFRKKLFRDVKFCGFCT